MQEERVLTSVKYNRIGQEGLGLKKSYGIWQLRGH